MTSFLANTEEQSTCSVASKSTNINTNTGVNDKTAADVNKQQVSFVSSQI
jgi:hypothetical protein